MRALNNIQTRNHKSVEQVSLFTRFLSIVSRMSETIWLCTTFLLFIVMGPFSVIAVLYGLWALATGENKERMVEPARC